MNDPGLREELQKIDKVISIEKDLEDQITSIQKLKTQYPHSIELVVEETKVIKIVHDYDNGVYLNCYMFCFDIKWGDIKNKSQNGSQKFPVNEYACHLIKNFLCEIDHTKAEDGDYVIYFSDDKPQHAGRFCGGKIISKWGKYHVWRHGLLEVPTRYGEEVRYFKKISKDQCLLAFEQWSNPNKTFSVKRNS